MVPIKGDWTPFIDLQDQLVHYRQWGLIPAKSQKLRPVMVVDGYFGKPEPCRVAGYQGDNWAVIELADGFHAIHGEYLAEQQPIAHQKLPFGSCFAEILAKYIVLDIETTGFDFHRDRIIEIAAVSYEYGVKTAEYHTLVDPGMPLPSDIVKLTGISQADVDHAPALNEIAPGFLAFIGDTPLVGHNAVSFDVPFLSTQLSHNIQNPVIDTLPIARKVFDLLPRHKLEYLNKVLDLGSAGSHRAGNDVDTTNALLWACLSPRRYERKVFSACLDERTHTSPPPARKGNPRKAPTAPTRSKFQKVDIKAIVPTCDCTNSTSPLCGKAIVFTGELSISREEAMQMAVNAGAVLKTSVSRKTAYLVVGKQHKDLVGIDGMSSKEEKARALNQTGQVQIQIISESEFIKLVKEEGTTV